MEGIITQANEIENYISMINLAKANNSSILNYITEADIIKIETVYSAIFNVKTLRGRTMITVNVPKVRGRRVTNIESQNTIHSNQ